MMVAAPHADITKSSEILAEKGYKIVGILGTGFEAHGKGAGYRYTMGVEPESSKVISEYKAGYYTTSEGKTKLIDIKGTTTEEAKQYIENLKSDKNVISISLSSHYALDKEKAAEGYDPLLRSKSDKKVKGETRSVLAFDKEGNLLGHIITPSIHYSDAYKAAEQVYGDNLGKVVHHDGDFYAQTDLELKGFSNAYGYKNQNLLIEKIKEEESLDDVVIKRSWIDKLRYSLENKVVDKVGDLWERKLKEPIIALTESTKKSIVSLAESTKKSINTFKANLAKAKEDLYTNMGEIFFGKAAHAGEIPDHLRYLQPTYEIKTKLEVDLRIREDMEARVKQGEDPDLPWWKRLGNFAKRIFGQATKFAKNQWNRMFGRNSWIRRSFRAVQNVLTGGGSQALGSGVDEYADERRKAQEDRVQIRSALGLSTTGGGRYNTEKAKFGKNEKIVFDRLVSEGFSKSAIAAIMGHWKQESGFNPHIIEAKNGVAYGITATQPRLKHGYGLAQWTSYKKGSNTRQGQMPSMTGDIEKDINLQIDFFIKELKGQTKGLAKSSQVWDQLYKAETLDQAMAAMKGYEAYGIAGKRAKMAKEYDELLTSMQVSDPVDEPSDINSDGSVKLDAAKLFITMNDIYSRERASTNEGVSFKKLQVYTSHFIDDSPRGSYDYTLGRGSDRKVGIPMPFSGEVISVLPPKKSGGYGWDVLVYDPQTKTTHRLAHMSKVMVKAGDTFEKGQVIMNQGTTGFSTGDHVHHEIHAGKITYAQSVGSRPNMIRDRSKTRPIVESMLDFWRTGSDGVTTEQDQEDKLNDLQEYMKTGQIMTPAFIDIVAKKGGLSAKEIEQLQVKVTEYNSTLSQKQQQKLKQIEEGKLKDPFKDKSKDFGRSVEEIPAATGDVISSQGVEYNGTFVRATRTGEKDNFGNEKLLIEMIVNGKVVDSVYGGSGQRRRQLFKHKGNIERADRGVAPLPEGVYAIGAPSVVRGSHGAGLGNTWMGLTPTEGYSTPGRSGFGIHRDSNRTKGAPGSAGCLVTYDQDGIDKLAQWRKEYGAINLVADWGLGTIKEKYKGTEVSTPNSADISNVPETINFDIKFNKTKRIDSAWANRAPQGRTTIPNKIVFTPGHWDQTSKKKWQGAPGEAAWNLKVGSALKTIASAIGIEAVYLDNSNTGNKSLHQVGNTLKQYEQKGYYAFEIHADRNDHKGRSGVIPGAISEAADIALAKEFGSFSQSAYKGYVLPKRGVALLETAAMNEVNKLNQQQQLEMADESAMRILRALYPKKVAEFLKKKKQVQNLQSNSNPKLRQASQVVANVDTTIGDIDAIIEKQEQLTLAMVNLNETKAKVRDKNAQTSKAITVPSNNDLRTGQEDTIRTPMKPTVAVANVTATAVQGTNKITNVIELSNPQKYIMSSIIVNDTIDNNNVPYNDTISRA